MKTDEHTTLICADDVASHPLSFADPNGRLFWWNGRLYRGIVGDSAALYRELFARGTVERLVAKGLLIDTELSSHRLEPYPVVLHHKIIPFISYPFEWCAPMLKDAALAVLDLVEELAREGLTLQDGHSWNVLFDGTRPVWVDFGSIVRPTRPGWPAYNEFCQFFLYPLHLMARGHGRMARWLLHDNTTGVLESDVRAIVGAGWWDFTRRSLMSSARTKAKTIMPGAFRPALRRVAARIAPEVRELAAPSSQDAVDRVRQVIEAINLPPPRGGWAEYYEGLFPAFTPSQDWTVKHRSAFEILSTLRPKSVLDIGSNRGWYAQLAARLGSRVVAFDVDEPSLSRLYLDSRMEGLPVLPLVMDFRNPSPAFGFLDTWFPPAAQRLRCDMVLALALVHHLVFKRSLNFEQIAEGLFTFSNRWAVAEFVSPEDRYVKEWLSPRYAWYSLENFLAALGRRFRTIKVYPSHPNTRLLILCEAEHKR